MNINRLSVYEHNWIIKKTVHSSELSIWIKNVPNKINAIHRFVWMNSHPAYSHIFTRSKIQWKSFGVCEYFSLDYCQHLLYPISIFNVVVVQSQQHSQDIFLFHASLRIICENHNKMSEWTKIFSDRKAFHT